MKIQTINELNTYFDPGVGHAKGRGQKIFNRSEIIICTNENVRKIVRQEIERLGVNADLNHLDVSHVTDMNRLFSHSSFNGDISQWDTSNVKDMSDMFGNSKFNGNISNWDISKVRNMFCMFYYSDFNNDISNWKINLSCNCAYMFFGCSIKQDYKPRLPE